MPSQNRCAAPTSPPGLTQRQAPRPAVAAGEQDQAPAVPDGGRVPGMARAASTVAADPVRPVPGPSTSPRGQLRPHAGQQEREQVGRVADVRRGG